MQYFVNTAVLLVVAVILVGCCELYFYYLCVVLFVIWFGVVGDVGSGHALAMCCSVLSGETFW